MKNFLKSKHTEKIKGDILSIFLDDKKEERRKKLNKLNKNQSFLNKVFKFLKNKI